MNKPTSMHPIMLVIRPHQSAHGRSTHLIMIVIWPHQSAHSLRTAPSLDCKRVRGLLRYVALVPGFARSHISRNSGSIAAGCTPPSESLARRTRRLTAAGSQKAAYHFTTNSSPSDWGSVSFQLRTQPSIQRPLLSYKVQSKHEKKCYRICSDLRTMTWAPE